jgi:hypothetical protein
MNIHLLSNFFDFGVFLKRLIFDWVIDLLLSDSGTVTRSCVLAVCTKPGEVAEKSNAGFHEELLAAAGKALGRSLSVPEGGDYTPTPFAKPTEAAKGGSGSRPNSGRGQ